MQTNRLILESSDITKHYMTAEETATKIALCRLLVDKNHRKYAERFYKNYELNIVSSAKFPKFTAAVSTEEATIFISDGFLGNGQGIFNQLDVLLRHELAHELMLHQVRMIAEFKEEHKNDRNPDKAVKHIRYSSSLHRMLNIIMDFEISNTRYSMEDKEIVRNMMLNGKVIGGLITEEHRDWSRMPLEQMYKALREELDQINKDIRSNPNWAPIKAGTYSTLDMIKHDGANLIRKYSNITRPSSIRAPLDIFIKTKTFSKWADMYQEIVVELYEKLKDLTSDSEKASLLDIVEDIAVTGPFEKFEVKHPQSGEDICTLYTPEDKQIAGDVLKNLAGNINFDPTKFKVKKKQNTKEYKNAWNKIINKLDSKKFDDETLRQLRDAIDSM